MDRMLMFVKDEAGQDAMEYSLLIVLITCVTVFALVGFGESLREFLSRLQKLMDRIR